MTRNEILRERAALRRATKSSNAFEANQPENLYMSDQEIFDAWEDAGVLDAYYSTQGDQYDGWD